MHIPRLSFPLVMTILIPGISGILMLGLVLFTFDAAREVAVQEHQRKAEELVGLAASSVEALWIAPRNRTIRTLAGSDTLERRLAGDAPFSALADEWRLAEELLPGYFFIYYGLEDGTIEYHPPGDLSEGFDPRERPWYKAGMSAGEGPVWTAPYEEDITGETVVSTVLPIVRDGRRTGVMSSDIQFRGLQTILEDIEPPSGGSVFLVDKTGSPFIGTDESHVGRDRLPASNDEFFVASSDPMSNGWRASVVVPRAALAESFAALLQPVMVVSALILLFGGGITSVLVARFASRAYRLASYFEQTREEDYPLREIFRTRDELSFLNQRFNQVTHEARVGEERKIAQERNFRLLIEQAPVGFFRTTPEGELLYINPHCTELLGYEPGEAMPAITSVRKLYYDGSDRDRFLHDLFAHGEVQNRKMRFVNASGEPFWISMTAHIREDSTGGEARDIIEGFLIDVTDDIEERDSLARMAESDPLTGAANRRGFDDVAESVARRADSTGQRVALIIFDVDRFKTINDTYGHDVGDGLLQQIASMGKHNLREGDLFARIGGDEFAVLLPGASEGAAIHLAQRLREDARGMPLPEPLTVPPTLSIGVAVQVGSAVRIPELFKAADNSMYEAKEAGRDRIGEVGGD